MGKVGELSETTICQQWRNLGKTDSIPFNFIASKMCFFIFIFLTILIRIPLPVHFYMSSFLTLEPNFILSVSVTSFDDYWFFKPCNLLYNV